METTQQLEPTKENILKLTKNGLLIFMYFIKGLRINGNKIKNIKNPFYDDKKGGFSISLRTDKWSFFDFGDPTYKGDCFEFAKLWYKKKEGLELKFNELLPKLFLDLNLSDPKNASFYQEKEIELVTKSIPEIVKPFKLYERSFNQEDERYFSQYGISTNVLYDNCVTPVVEYEYYDLNSSKWIEVKSSTPMYAFKGVKNGKNYAKIYRPTPKFFSWVGVKPPNYIFGTELLCAVEGEEKYLIITAGEKDVLTLLSLGYNAICLNSETCDAPQNLSRDIYESNYRPVILYDIDETGLKRGIELAIQLNCRNAVLPNSLKEKGGKDVSDWIKLGLSIEELKSIIDGAQNIGDICNSKTDIPMDDLNSRSLSGVLKENESKKSYVISADKLLGYKIEEIPTLLEPLLPAVGLVALAGSSDTGKSSLLRQLATSICLKEEKVFDFKINAKHNSCVYVSTEDDEYAMSFLLNKQNKEKNHMPEEYKNLRYIFNSEKIITKLDEELKASPADLIIVDAYSDIFLGEVNQVNKVRGFLEEYSNLAKNHKCLIIFLHHTSKNSENKEPSKNNLLGSQGFEAKMRTVIELRQDPSDSNLRHLCIVKGNYLSKEYKTDSFELKFDDNMLFSSTGNRVPFNELIKQGEDEYDKLEIIKEINSLRDQGMSIREIAVKTGLSKTKVHKLQSN